MKAITNICLWEGGIYTRSLEQLQQLSHEGTRRWEIIIDGRDLDEKMWPCMAISSNRWLPKREGTAFTAKVTSGFESGLIWNLLKRNETFSFHRNYWILSMRWASVQHRAARDNQVIRIVYSGMFETSGGLCSAAVISKILLFAEHECSLYDQSVWDNCIIVGCFQR